MLRSLLYRWSFIHVLHGQKACVMTNTCSVHFKTMPMVALTS